MPLLQCDNWDWFLTLRPPPPCQEIFLSTLIETRYSDYSTIWGSIWYCPKPWAKLLRSKLQGSLALDPKITVFVTMVKTSAPVTNIWQTLIFKIHPNLAALLKFYGMTSTQRLVDVESNSNPHETSTPSLRVLVWVMDRTNWFTNIFSHWFGSISDGNIMDLYPEIHFIETKFFNGWVSVISL